MHAPDQSELPLLLSTGIALLEPDGRVSWLNPALAEMLGVGQRTATGQELTALMRNPALGPHLDRTLTEPRGFTLRTASLGVGRGQELVADVSIQPSDRDRILVEVHPLASDLAPAD